MGRRLRGKMEAPVEPEPLPEEEDDEGALAEGEYIVEKIKDYTLREVKNDKAQAYYDPSLGKTLWIVQYLVKWKGYEDPAEDTWEPEESFNAWSDVFDAECQEIYQQNQKKNLRKRLLADLKRDAATRNQVKRDKEAELVKVKQEALPRTRMRRSLSATPTAPAQASRATHNSLHAQFRLQDHIDMFQDLQHVETVRELSNLLPDTPPRRDANGHLVSSPESATESTSASASASASVSASASGAHLSENVEMKEASEKAKKKAKGKGKGKAKDVVEKKLASREETPEERWARKERKRLRKEAKRERKREYKAPVLRPSISPEPAPSPVPSPVPSLDPQMVPPQGMEVDKASPLETVMMDDGDFADENSDQDDIGEGFAEDFEDEPMVDVVAECQTEQPAHPEIASAPPLLPRKGAASAVKADNVTPAPTATKPKPSPPVKATAAPKIALPSFKKTKDVPAPSHRPFAVQSPVPPSPVLPSGAVTSSGRQGSVEKATDPRRRPPPALPPTARSPAVSPLPPTLPVVPEDPHIPLNKDVLRPKLAPLDFLRNVRLPASFVLPAGSDYDVAKICEAWKIPNVLEGVPSLEYVLTGKEAWIYAPLRESLRSKATADAVMADYLALQYLIQHCGAKQARHLRSEVDVVFVHVSEEAELLKLDAADGGGAESKLAGLEGHRRRSLDDTIFILFGGRAVQTGLKKEMVYVFRQFWSVQAAMTVTPNAFTANADGVKELFEKARTSRKLVPLRRDKFAFVPQVYLAGAASAEIGPFHAPPRLGDKTNLQAFAQYPQEKIEAIARMHALVSGGLASLVPPIPYRKTPYEGFSFPVDLDERQHTETELRLLETWLPAKLAQTDVPSLLDRIRGWRPLYPQIRRWVLVSSAEEAAEFLNVFGIELMTLDKALEMVLL